MVQNRTERSLRLLSVGDVVAIISVVVAIIFGTLQLVLQMISLLLNNKDKKK